MPELPTGTVTFLFTDIEGSTRLLQELGEGYRGVHDLYVEIVRDALKASGGREVRTEGDSFFAAFRTAPDGVRGAVAVQRGLAAAPWPHGRPLRVRIGLHTGAGVLGGGDYIGLDVHRAARIAGVAHGGQVLISDATEVLARSGLPEGVTVRDLGRHELKDFDEPRPLFDLVIDNLSADFPPLRTLGGAGRTNLPVPRTSFLGREQALDDLIELLARTRLVTLTGPGGSGKTRLALRAAAEMFDRMRDGVHMVDLSAVRDPQLVPSSIASSLGLAERSGVDLADTLIAYLRERELLLLLDNFEQVAEAAPIVGRILDGAPEMRILVTSRMPLRVSGEREYPVEPLALPKADALDIVSSSEAVRLFVERAAAVRPDFEITEDNARAIAAIARRVDGLPLAIELAAVRVKMLDPQQLLTRLEVRLPLLTGGPSDVPERQRTLQGAIEWSYDLLEPDERELFVRLAVFRGGWTLDSAEAVCGEDVEVLDGLGSLVDKSLVRANDLPPGGVRFGMLETVHEFAAGRLVSLGDVEAVYRRHAEHFRNLAEEAERGLTREDQDRWMQRLEREHENLRGALDWAESVLDSDTAQRISAALWRFWRLSARLAEGRARLERSLALPGGDRRDELRARTLGALGGLLYWQQDYEPMQRAYEEAVDIARELGNPAMLARALFDLSFAPFVTDETFERPRELLTQALGSAPEDDPVLQTEIRMFLGFLTASEGGDAQPGIEAIEELISVHRRRGDRLHTADYLFRLTGLKLLRGDRDAAWNHLRETVTLLAGVNSPTVVAMTLAASSMLASHEGDHERAARLLGAGGRILDEGAGGGPPPVFLSQYGDPEGAARAALGDDGFERAFLEGYAMSKEQASAYAQEGVSGVDA